MTIDKFTILLFRDNVRQPLEKQKYTVAKTINYWRFI